MKTGPKNLSENNSPIASGWHFEEDSNSPKLRFAVKMMGKTESNIFPSDDDFCT